MEHVLSLASVGADSDMTCRAEANWTEPYGPPYALVQGTFRNVGMQANGKMLLTDMPREGAPVVQRGDVCLIGGGPDFFIALADHPEWGNGHTVWGHVEDMEAVDAIARLPVTAATWGTTAVTPLVTPLPFVASVPQFVPEGSDDCEVRPKCTTE